MPSGGPRRPSRGVEHRLETVAIANGIRYVNDSQGTQPDAVIAALRAFPAPVVLIAGGRDKGVDLAELAGVVAERAAAAVLIGESAGAMADLFAGRGPGQDRAGRDARRGRRGRDEHRPRRAGRDRRRGHGPAGPVATVLLSPAAASFDMFVDYVARGRAFKAAVGRLIGRGAA